MRCPHCGAPLGGGRGRCLVCGGRLSPEMLPRGHALVVHAGTPLRDRAGSPAAVLQTLSRGETVELLAREGSFVQVRVESGATGYIDALNVREPQPQPEPEVTAIASVLNLTMPERSLEEPETELPYGLPMAPGERLLYYGRFLYDPFNDRAFVVTSNRLIIGGGGAVLPRVYELAEIVSAGLREGSNGMALGERTLVLEIASVPGELYIAALRDPERALACVLDATRETGLRTSPPAPLLNLGEESPTTASRISVIQGYSAGEAPLSQDLATGRR